MSEDPELEKALKDHDRLQAVTESGLLDSPLDSIFEDLTDAVQMELGVPMSLVTIIEVKRQFFKSSRGLPPDVAAKRETPMEDSACQYVVKKRSLIVIDDVQQDPMFKMHAGLRKINAGSYLGVPLFHQGEIIGSVCAIDTKPRKWTEKEIDFMEEKASSLKTELSGN